ncbi:hypothetical protein B484DRAFT_451048 [Ochromonadaceae sp. CCMP2298]|nr:hypothetical protein B484DRAFT_451048 [Ochromonadaceae sp. CCMP2298]|mmetsp:Transcript_34317/g.75633  ORF Transcript_34317/g.75633 Transcript_34317/m.75633 type:complete len:155 (+) Transcript_34317:74-538(+)|eukprot:CAMPEP_0173205766 /NCGR_PEP_ID=MMETSP1141-20130122/20944_1 /TAXON_ID=483371 /ORGANISM="non described non described, Strain CCMP2298" /LENGTH=154 /DNA_ID=CAMNT_0014131745 /DNA_START=72 /DNA_END=536 /DNA_ORIENTATION=+
MQLLAVLLLTQVAALWAFAPRAIRPSAPRSTLKMIEIEANTATYVGMFLATIVPSLILVKFVGDAADGSRDNISDETREKFKRAMMEQPGQNFQIPTSDEDELKKQIAKAYIQDKDVDVAVLEEKLRKRVQWRKEVMAQERASAQIISEDEDGW